MLDALNAFSNQRFDRWAGMRFNAVVSSSGQVLAMDPAYKHYLINAMVLFGIAYMILPGRFAESRTALKRWLGFRD